MIRQRDPILVLAFVAVVGLLAALFCSVASANDGFAPVPGVTISGPVLVIEALPEFTAEMDSDEFFAWAIDQNRKSVEESHRRHEAIKRTIPDKTQRVTISERSDHIGRRFGGGVGAGGFGGQGGYSGYTDDSGGGMMLGGGYNLGFGFSNPGNASNTQNDSFVKTYDLIYTDRTYYGSPVTVINPYCKPKRHPNDH